MKKLLLLILLCAAAHNGYSQAYIPMPADSAVWRYRINDIDFITQILDGVLLLNGTDTVIGGTSYHKIISRQHQQTVPNGTVVAIVADTATGSDNYYAAIRESGKQVFLFEGGVEKMIFDFNAVVGDSIPAYYGKVMVTAIDSILLGGQYHKRYRTTDAGYYVIEGVGSSRGLIPGLDDGSYEVQFLCFTDNDVVYSPDPTLPCTYVYPLGIGMETAVTNTAMAAQINIFPVPASEVIHITASCLGNISASVTNSVGQQVWSGEIAAKEDILISSWPKGIYIIRFLNPGIGYTVKKMIIQ